MTAREKVIEAIKEFRWWNYGLDNIDPTSKYAEWVPDLADEILAVLAEHMERTEKENTPCND